MHVALTDHPDVTAVIPTLGANESRLRACVAALEAQITSKRFAILVIVNSPTSPTPVLDVPLASVVRAGMNLGWAGGLALGRTLTDAPQLWLVQDDMTPEVDCLARLSHALDQDPGLASVAPIVIDEMGMVRRHSCGGELGPDGNIALPFPEKDTPQDELENGAELDYIPGRGTLVRTADWDNVGGMDPRFYPVLWVDVDFCAALRSADRRFAIERSAVASHETNGSTPSALGQFLFGRNQYLFATKWIAGASKEPDTSRPSRAADLDGALHPKIEPHLLAIVAQTAADAFLHLARVHDSVLKDLHHQIADSDTARQRLEVEIAAVQNSNSWRLTRPIRWTVRGARRVLAAITAKSGR